MPRVAHPTVPTSHRSAGEANIAAFEELPMRVGVGQARDLEARRLRFLNQLGVEELLLSPLDTLPSNDLEPGDPWPLQELVQARNRVEDAGLRLFGFEHVPVRTYGLLLDDERRAEKIEVVAESIRNVGRAGIPTLGHSGHHPDGVWRSSRSKPVRGVGVLGFYSSAEFADAPPTLEDDVTEEELWDAYGEFLDGVVPAAEEHWGAGGYSGRVFTVGYLRRRSRPYAVADPEREPSFGRPERRLADDVSPGDEKDRHDGRVPRWMLGT